MPGEAWDSLERHHVRLSHTFMSSRPNYRKCSSQFFARSAQHPPPPAGYTHMSQGSRVDPRGLRSRDIPSCSAVDSLMADSPSPVPQFQTTETKDFVVVQESSMILASSLPTHLIHEETETRWGQGACLTSYSESATRTLAYRSRHCFPDQIPTHFIPEVCPWKSHFTPLNLSFLLCESEGDRTSLWGCREDKVD